MVDNILFILQSVYRNLKKIRYNVSHRLNSSAVLELGAQNEEDSEGTEKDEEREDEGEANEVEELPLPLFGNGQIE